jgi:hypothetical protein
LISILRFAPGAAGSTSTGSFNAPYPQPISVSDKRNEAQASRLQMERQAQQDRVGWSDWRHQAPVQQR